MLKTKLHFGQLEFWDHISEFIVTYTDNPDKIMVEPNGPRALKGAHSLVQRVARNKGLWVELSLEYKNCEIFIF
jgi:hypothetical protein